MYDTFQEAQQKLSGCVVSYNDKPFRVSNAADSDGTIFLYGDLIDEKEEIKCPMDDPRWDFRGLGERLGYASVDYHDYHQAVYTRRIPVRSSHKTQGLSRHNVRISRMVPNKVVGLPGSTFQWDSLVAQKGFRKMWAGDYPSVAKVRAELSDPTITSRPIGRHLAITRSSLGVFYLMYKGEAIGYSEDLERFRIPPQFRYLDELLVEDHNLKIQ